MGYLMKRLPFIIAGLISLTLLVHAGTSYRFNPFTRKLDLISDISSYFTYSTSTYQVNISTAVEVSSITITGFGTIDTAVGYGSANEVLHTDGAGNLTWDTDDGGSGGASTLQVKVNGVEVSSPTASIDIISQIVSGAESPSGEANITISTQVIGNYFSVSSHTHSGVYEPVVTEGSLSDSVIVSADIKDGVIALADLAAATSGYLVNWSNLDNVPAGFADGTDDDVPEAGDFGALTGGRGIDNDAGTLNVSTGAVTNGDTAHIPDADQVYDFCETTQDYYKSGDEGTIAAAIAEGQYADSTIVSADIKDGVITLADLAAATSGYLVNWANMDNVSVTGAQILDDTIDSDDYAGGSIDAEHLAADIIDETKIADNGIDSEHYNDGSIDLVHLSAATSGYLVNWNNLDNVPAGVTEVKDKLITLTTPYALTTGQGYAISPIRSYAITITTATAWSSGGGSVVFMIEQRALATVDSAGTDIWTGDVTAGAAWKGGTANDFTCPANYGLFAVITSVTGAVRDIKITYRYTVD